MSTVLLCLRVFQNKTREVCVFKSLDLLFTYIIVFEKVCASDWCHLFPWWLVMFETFFEMVYLTAKQLIAVDAGNSIIPNLWTFLFSSSISENYTVCFIAALFIWSLFCFQKEILSYILLLCPSSWT